jgi:hypothetical protein
VLNQVEEGQPPLAVVLGDRDHQAQIGLDQFLLGVEVAPLHPRARSTSSRAVSSRTLPMPLRNSCSESVVTSG